MNKQLKRIAGLLAMAFVAAIALTACTSTATPVAMCSFVLGNGQDGHDNKIHKVVWPGQNLKYSTDSEIGQYVPCNERNYIINDGSLKDASGKPIGDRHTPVVAYTQDGTKVDVYLTAYWTLNQTESVMKEFYAFCYKYTCYGDDSSAGAANFATDGWNGMLGENFSPTIDTLVLQNMPDFNDDIWKKHDATMWLDLAKDLSQGFAAAMQPKTGKADDLFCGSGNSGWTNPDEPGTGEFTCTNVRFEINKIEAADVAFQELADEEAKASQQASVNEKLLDAAKLKYGDQASYWLGLQDTLELCNKQTTCVVNFGGGGSSPSISIPQPAAPAAPSE